jgi:hypothetical protein
LLHPLIELCQKESVEGRPASPAMSSRRDIALHATSLQKTTNPSRRDLKCLCDLFPCCTAGIDGIQHPLA